MTAFAVGLWWADLDDLGPVDDGVCTPRELERIASVRNPDSRAAVRVAAVLLRHALAEVGQVPPASVVIDRTCRTAPGGTAAPRSSAGRASRCR